MYDIIELNGLLLNDLRELAKGLGIEDFKGLKKQDLIFKILEQKDSTPAAEKTEGRKKSVKAPKEDEIVPTTLAEESHEESEDQSAEDLAGRGVRRPRRPRPE
ncbi:MAG: Rho termination factor N-terminal domain-containing protein, partial [bacterium]